MKKWLWREGWIGWLVREIYRRKWKIIDYIPDDERLWRAVYKKDQLYATGEIKPTFFRDKNGLSCDIARFSTIEQSRCGYAPPPWPDAAGLVEIKAAHVRQVGGDVQHKPIRNDHPNYSHSQFTTLLQGDQLETIRRMSQFRVRPRRAEL